MVIMEEFKIEDKTYSDDELYKIGKLHYPKRYWIKRGIGIALWIAGLEYGISVPFTTIYWAFKIDSLPARVIVLILIFLPLVTILLAGTIVFLLSFRPESKDTYIEYAKKYLLKAEANLKARDVKLERRRLKQLANYKKLLDKGVLTQEEYDKKKEELSK